MIAKLMNALGFSDSDESDTPSDTSRREYARRSADKCIGLVNGQAMPILDWSPGGLRILGETRTYTLGEQIDVLLKFHLNDHLIDVRHTAEVVRKSSDFFAVKFSPLTSEINKTFQQVIDSFNAEEFAASQA